MRLRHLALLCLAVLAVGPASSGRDGAFAARKPMLDEISDVVYQLQNYRGGTLQEIVDGAYDLAVIDLARDAKSDYFTSDEIAAVQESGTRVLAYFEIGALEDFRTEFVAFTEDNPDLILNEWASWPGEFFVKYWDLRWWEQIVKPRIDQALEAGFDGVYLDTPLAYEEIDLRLVAGHTRDDLARLMVDLIVRISAHAKAADPDFWVFPQNSPELQHYPGYRDAVDGIGMEELFFRATDVPCRERYCRTNLAETRALRDAGKLVVAVDYAVEPENIAATCRRYRTEGFAGTVTVGELDRVPTPCQHIDLS